MRESLIERINRLRRERNAVILAHNYQLPEIQDIADEVGDSLELARKAARSEADVIVFCGVRFMAETAALLAPDKTVLLPEPTAGCPMADMARAEDVRRLKESHPGAAVVCYVNTSVEVKAECDLCCTSANAVKIVETIEPEREVIFLPDKNLGHYVQTRLNRPLILWQGFCPSHVRILLQDVQRARHDFPGALIMVHPESPSEVVEAADMALGTGGMCRVAREAEQDTIVVGTEIGMLHRLRKENPDKRFVPLAEQAVCRNMKKTTLESVDRALSDMTEQVTIPKEIAARALASVQRMVEVG